MFEVQLAVAMEIESDYLANYVFVPRGCKDERISGHEDGSILEGRKLLNEIENSIRKHELELWTLNGFIHETPELAFQEYKAHAAITAFLAKRNGTAGRKDPRYPSA